MLKTVKHFCNTNIFLQYNEPEKFVICQWQLDSSKPSLLYLIYRVFISLFYTTFLVCSLLNIERQEEHFSYGKWFIYLTHWAELAATLQFDLAAIMLFAFYFDCKKPLINAYRIYWLFYTVSVDVAPVVSFLFWMFDYNYKVNHFGVVSFIEHGMNSIFIICDILLVSHPVHLMHVVYSLCFGCVYGLFTFFYFLAGGTDKKNNPYIYRIVDWRNAKKTLIVAAGSLCGLIVVHFFSWVIYKSRNWIKSALCKTKNSKFDEDGRV